MSSSSSSENIPEDEYEALAEYSKALLAIRQLEQKKVKWETHANKLAYRHPFLTEIKIGGKRQREKSAEKTTEEEAENEKEKHKARNQKLKEKRKKKKEEKQKEKKTAEQLKEAEKLVGEMEVEKSPEVVNLHLDYSSSSSVSSSSPPPQAPPAKKASSTIQRIATRFSIKTPEKSGKDPKEGGLAPSVRSELQHSDESHRSDLSGNPTPVKE